MLSTRLRVWWGKQIGLLAFEINWILDLSLQVRDRPCGAAPLRGLEEHLPSFPSNAAWKASD